MPRLIDIIKYESRLDNLFDQFDSLPADQQIISHWSRYLCVLSYGYIETSIRALLLKYSRDNSTPYIGNYVEKKLEQFRNAKMSNIIDLLNLFNPLWEEQLKNSVDQESFDAINSIADNRHKIAHGKDVGVSRILITNWYNKSKEFIEWLEIIL